MGIRNVIYFNTKEKLNKKRFEQFLQTTIGNNKFFWVDEFWDFFHENDIDPSVTYISMRKEGKRGFKFLYDIYDTSSEDELSLRQKIKLLTKLSVEEVIQVLSTDDEIRPWSYVFVEPTGETSTVEVEYCKSETEEDELEIEGFYNHLFGGFRTLEIMNPDELKKLQEYLKKACSKVEIEYFGKAEKINPDFSLEDARFKDFDHYYEIQPQGKNVWWDKEERSELFVEIMTRLQNETGKSFCLFPANHSVIEGIEGGSDSEEHCLLISKNGIEKVIYKQRRKSW